MPETSDSIDATEDPAHPSVETVEALVRARMAASLGGRRGIVEAAVPSIAFTVLWLLTKDLTLSLVVAGGLAVVALAVRVAQRSTTQYVLNALVGIAIGWVFVRISASSGGDETQQALAFFLPGLISGAVYTVVVGGSALAGWPLVGFMIGSVMGDPTAWHEDRQVVRLCSRLTWLLVAPGALGVLLQTPVWILGHAEIVDGDTAVGIIAFLRYGLGWVFRIAAWGTMIWLLARNATPLTPPEPAGGSAAVGPGGE
ncbi:MAG: DUF3159 domain-containing protein [Nocardioides sp.]|uniref:DUF3159 domain-containing protein n=1 Tax=Nocardioides sp. TaxID=35761 RepID=UPI0039E4F454